jgi:hypothetical protein
MHPYLIQQMTVERSRDLRARGARRGLVAQYRAGTPSQAGTPSHAHLLSPRVGAVVRLSDWWGGRFNPSRAKVAPLLKFPVLTDARAEQHPRPICEVRSLR